MPPVGTGDGPWPILAVMVTTSPTFILSGGFQVIEPSGRHVTSWSRSVGVVGQLGGVGVGGVGAGGEEGEGGAGALVSEVAPPTPDREDSQDGDAQRQGAKTTDEHDQAADARPPPHCPPIIAQVDLVSTGRLSQTCWACRPLSPAERGLGGRAEPDGKSTPEHATTRSILGQGP